MGQSGDGGGPQVRRQGRWRTGMQSRQRILDAARARFTELGYDRTTVRAVAADAGVEPAMVHYFFGSKQELLAATMRLPAGPKEAIGALVEAGLDDLGAGLVRHFLHLWDSSGFESFLTLIRSGPVRDDSTTVLRDFLAREVTGQLAGAIGGPDGELRASLITGQIFGLAAARYLLGLEPLASADHETVVAWLGPLIQQLVTGPAPAR
ncbi:TetR family transcriptional regulator [Nonomuraea sp. NPDC005983]|uniref:TetR/AcrR family transcriptional regulator n=1 Tax=Nonomuraea sp. NPDC005983 TaxID=3155595 RepID=UPI00339FDA5B